MEQSARKIFLISPVRRISPTERYLTELYIKEREHAGCAVHWPLRDTNQKDDHSGLRIAQNNREAIVQADAVHLWYSPTSSGSIFDLAMAIIFKKELSLANPEEVLTPNNTDYLALLIRNELIPHGHIKNMQPEEDSFAWLTLDRKKLSVVSKMMIKASLTPITEWEFNETAENIFFFGGFFASMREQPKQLKLKSKAEKTPQRSFTNLALEIAQATQERRRII